MAITLIKDFFSLRGSGKGVYNSGPTKAGGTTTAAATNSGGVTIHLGFHELSTLPGTLIGMPFYTTPPAEVYPTLVHGNINGPGGLWLARLYNMGTLNLAATGNQFTADASVTFPVTRKRFGQTGAAVPLLPVIYITTATTTTAAAIRLQTATGTSGYTDQDGNATIGSTTFTMPAAATAVQSAFLLRLNAGDVAVTAINQIRVDTAASAGAARIFGMELICPLDGSVQNYTNMADCVLGGGGFGTTPLDPAAPTAGTLTTYLGVAVINRTTAEQVVIGYEGVLNN